MPKNEEVSLASLGIQMPYSMQAEQSVLGAALVDETVLNRLITDMEPEMFYSDQNRAIYETMRSLYTESEAVDIVTPPARTPIFCSKARSRRSTTFVPGATSQASRRSASPFSRLSTRCRS